MAHISCKISRSRDHLWEALWELGVARRKASIHLLRGECSADSLHIEEYLDAVLRGICGILEDLGFSDPYYDPKFRSRKVYSEMIQDFF